MNWLHSFWGVGATLGPVIMSFSLASTNSWREGYSSISIIQLSLGGLILICLPFWNKVNRSKGTLQKSSSTIKVKKMFQTKSVLYTFIIMMLYCTVEASIGLWGSTYLHIKHKLNVETSASLIAFYFGGITVGRFLSGFLSFLLNNRQLIRGGLMIVFLGILGLLLSSSTTVTGLIIVIIGIGLAPIFPSMLHETPIRFGRENAQILIGYQMGFAYIGSAFLSPGIGIVLQVTNVTYLPPILLIIVGILLSLSELLNKKIFQSDNCILAKY